MILRASNLSLPGRLFDASLEIAVGELVCLVGPNGSGKTSLLHALAGIGRPSGEVSLDGVDPRTLGPARRAAYLTYLPATRDIPWPLLARDLIALGGGSADFTALELAPLLDRRIDTLSTGERSRVLIARALAPRPKLLLLDEPSLGLAPLIIKQIFEIIRKINAESGTTIFLVEQNANQALKLAHRGYVMENGHITLVDQAENLLNNEDVKKAYLGL